MGSVSDATGSGHVPWDLNRAIDENRSQSSESRASSLYSNPQHGGAAFFVDDSTPQQRLAQADEIRAALQERIGQWLNNANSNTDPLAAIDNTSSYQELTEADQHRVEQGQFFPGEGYFISEPPSAALNNQGHPIPEPPQNINPEGWFEPEPA